MEEAIRQHERFADDAEAAAFWAKDAAPVASVTDLSYKGAAGQTQAARLYRGREGAGAPVLLYIHGGGWSGGSIALNERACRGIAAESGWAVLSISYRLAPRDPFPAGLEDCRAALRWLRIEAPALGLDAGRIAAGGASAGANLAMATALAEPGALAALVLFYGVFGADFDTPSYRAYGEGFGLTRARMMDLFHLYDPDSRRHDDPLVAPLASPAPEALPPCLLVAAELDILAEDSRAMATALKDAGVTTEYHVEPGVTHGFINRGRLVPAATDCLSRAARFLARHTQPEKAE
jgi:acetyl esterase